MTNDLINLEDVIKRDMTLFLVIDQSGSMAGEKIGAVNTAIREAIPMLRDVGGSDANIRIAALLFSSGCRWMYPEPMAAAYFEWTPVEAFGVTDLGAALQELDNKMSRKSFLNSPSASVAPAIFLMSDGQPTDEYAIALKQLQNNNWFKHSIKVAIAIGGDADKNILEEFTGAREAVITLHTPESLRKFIRFVTLTTVKIGTDSHNDPNRTKQIAMIQNIEEFKNENSDIDENAPDQWD